MRNTWNAHILTIYIIIYTYIDVYAVCTRMNLLILISVLACLVMLVDHLSIIRMAAMIPYNFCNAYAITLAAQESPLGKCYLAADPIAPLRD